MKTSSRRIFLKQSLFAAGTAGLSPLLLRGQSNTNVHAQITGANDDVRVAVVGLNSRGKNHLDNFQRKGSRVVAICDVDTAVLDKMSTYCKEKFNTAPQTFQDYRKLLENKDVDAIALATPNHWHALGGIWAAQAGKDVFVEKPISHNVWEGRKLVEAARKYNRIMQAGTQTRSSFAIREAIGWLHAGNLGKITLARTLCFNRRDTIGKATAPVKIPDTVDYDQWCGPAPMEKELWRKKFHYDWHWVWPTGNGDLGNQGVHQVDMVRWALGYDAVAPRVFSLGGRLGYDDDGTTPNTMISWLDYKPVPIIFEVRGLPTKSGVDKMDQYRGQRGVSAVFECEGGFMIFPNYTSAIAFDNDAKEIKKWEGADNHYANFIKAVRSRKVSDLNADILEGHLSAAISHQANISYQLGSKKSPEAVRDAVRNDKAVAEALGRMEEHLTANLVDLKNTTLTLGPVLEANPATERFTNSDAANKLLTREYRAPYIVPEKV
jgi:predicted dehydrogenase